MIGRLREAVLWLGAGLGALCIVWTLGILVSGVTPLVFTSGSMSPAIAAGDLGFARTIDASEIEVDDVVSVVNAKDVRVTHRVIDVQHEGKTAVLRLQGDANQIPDDELYTVTEAERIWFSVPKLGYVVKGASSQYGMFAGGMLVAVVLMLAMRPRPAGVAE